MAGVYFAIPAAVAALAQPDVDPLHRGPRPDRAAPARRGDALGTEIGRPSAKRVRPSIGAIRRTVSARAIRRVYRSASGGFPGVTRSSPHTPTRRAGLMPLRRTPPPHRPPRWGPV